MEVFGNAIVVSSLDPANLSDFVPSGEIPPCVLILHLLAHFVK